MSACAYGRLVQCLLSDNIQLTKLSENSRTGTEARKHSLKGPTIRCDVCHAPSDQDTWTRDSLSKAAVPDCLSVRSCNVESNIEGTSVATTTTNNFQLITLFVGRLPSLTEPPTTCAASGTPRGQRRLHPAPTRKAVTLAFDTQTQLCLCLHHNLLLSAGVLLGSSSESRLVHASSLRYLITLKQSLKHGCSGDVTDAELLCSTKQFKHTVHHLRAKPTPLLPIPTCIQET
eukprot:5017555-Amphidinium_carterae.1